MTQAAVAPVQRVAAWRPALRRSSLRVVGMGAAAVGLAALQSAAPDRRLIVCPLRAVTGVPCPLCGGTTAAVHIGRLDIVGALAANPVAVCAALLLALAPLLFVLGVRVPAGRARVVALCVAAVVAEAWQLVRLGVLSW